MTDEKLQKRWDDWLKGRPVCIKCGRPIPDRWIPADGGKVCEGCVEEMWEV